MHLSGSDAAMIYGISDGDSDSEEEEEEEERWFCAGRWFCCSLIAF